MGALWASCRGGQANPSSSDRSGESTRLGPPFSSVGTSTALPPPSAAGTAPSRPRFRKSFSLAGTSAESPTPPPARVRAFRAALQKTGRGRLACTGIWPSATRSGESNPGHLTPSDGKHPLRRHALVSGRKPPSHGSVDRRGRHPPPPERMRAPPPTEPCVCCLVPPEPALICRRRRNRRVPATPGTPVVASSFVAPLRALRLSSRPRPRPAPPQGRPGPRD